MRRIIEYKLILNEYESSMNTEVNELLGMGWELYGYPSVSRGEYSTKIIQAMVRYHVEEQPNVPRPVDHYPEGMFTL